MAKRVFALVISLLIMSAPFTAFCSQKTTLSDVNSAVEGIVSFKKAELSVFSDSELFDALAENAGSYNSDWYYIAFDQYGMNVKSEKAVSSLKAKVNELYSDGLEHVKVTDLQRCALTLSALGENAANVSGYPLLADATYNRANYRPLNAQGANSASYALLLLDSLGCDIPENACNTREDIVDIILGEELEGGGFALFGSYADIDVTSIAVQALAPYRKINKVGKAIDRCIDILSERQQDSGAYKSFANEPCAESTAQVILALCAADIDPMTDGRFTKNGCSIVDGLLSFRLDDGSFCHFKNSGTDNMATYQSLCALVSVLRSSKGEKSFFDFKLKKIVQASEPAEKATKSTNRKTNSAVKNYTKQKATNNSNLVSESTENNSETELKSTKATKAALKKKHKKKQKSTEQITQTESTFVNTEKEPSTDEPMKTVTETTTAVITPTTRDIPYASAALLLVIYFIVICIKIKIK